MANIDLGNLTRYDGKIKQYAEDKYLSKNTANWQMTEKAGAVTCYPVPDTELEPIVDFYFTEILPAEGEKGLNNPSTITGVSSINIGRIGKNLLLKVASAPSWNGLSITANADGSYTIDGTFNGANEKYFALTDCDLLISGIKSSVRLDTSKTYTISAELVSGTTSADAATINFSYLNAANASVVLAVPSAIGKNYRSKVVADYVGGQFIFRLNVKVGAVFDNAVLRFQLEEGTEATDFEPPILSADANYAISLNDTYYSGSVNLATGLMTVAWWGETLPTTGTATVELRTSSVRGVYATTYGTMGARTAPTYFRSNYDNDGSVVYPRYSAGEPRVSVDLPYAILGLTSETATVETATAALTTFLTEHPCFVVYKMYTPITVQLTSMQIKSLFALDKNTPRLNTLYTDADSIQVGYQKHPARTAYELENAILALGGGE